MRAWEIFAVGVGLVVLGRWARDEPAVPNAAQVGGAIFVMFTLDLIDTGRGEALAKGLAWIFTASAGLTAIGPITKNIGTKSSSSGASGTGGAVPAQGVGSAT